MNIPVKDWQLINTEMQYAREAPQKFLAAWKNGIELAGEQFFNLKTSVAAADNKWQLAPNFKLIHCAIGMRSHGQQCLLALMYSFYDSLEGQKLLERVSDGSFVDALSALDLEGKKIISELLLNYVGW